MSRPKFAHAEGAAAHVLKQLGVDDPTDFPIEALAGGLNVGVIVERIDGSEGRLVRGTETSIIAVSDRVRTEAAKRFVVAHELGHLQLHARSQLALCTSDGLASWYHAHDGPEPEACAFARALLMPRSLAEPIVKRGWPDFDTVRALSNRFGVGFTVAALRYLQLTDERCAVVFSHKGFTRWYQTTEGFDHHLSMNTRLDSRTYAADAARGSDVPDKPELVSAPAWISRRGLDDFDDIYEVSFRMRAYDAVLTVLWIPSSARY